MRFAIVNESTKCSAADAQTMAAACQVQLANDFEPEWGLGRSEVICYADKGQAPSDAVLLVLLDDSDQAGALGYHSEGSVGDLYAKVFVAPSLENGSGLFGPDGVCSVVSHEILEARADPDVNHWVDGPVVEPWESVAYEVCDPCESDSYPVMVNGQQVYVSNFVLPSWFDLGGKPKFDFLGTCPGPFQLAPGGYAIVRNQRGGDRNIYAQTIGMRRKTEMRARASRRLGARF